MQQITIRASGIILDRAKRTDWVHRTLRTERIIQNQEDR
jgi:hypothetical protein